jgi:hypothetical protein
MAAVVQCDSVRTTDADESIFSKQPSWLTWWAWYESPGQTELGWAK